MSQTQRQDQFIANDVTSNSSNTTRPMLIKEYKKIGHGAFGTVVQAFLTPDNNKWYGPFAIKKVPAQTEYKSRELEILRIADHPNVVKLEYFFTHVSPQDNKMYQHLAMECLPETLQLEIHRYASNKLELPLKHAKLYTYQVARGMLYLHALGICHRDIKPSNVLVDPNTGVLKICDFGSAKKLEQNQPSISYICSRFYRAPELIVGCTQYTTQIDIWGLGCVMGEMLIGKAVFQGQEPLLQLREISKLLGPPDKRFLFFSNPSYDGPLFSKPLFTGSVAERFEKHFGQAGLDGVDLLMKILTYEPERRLSPRRILAHPFFEDLKKERYFFPRGHTQPKCLPELFDFTPFELQVIGELSSEILPLE
ncbi:LANO_0E05094g1_1 [Lachancea nothofagi CBS 11611]|uniref:LANO_0E05094g1_1 n=1 Tax=Lachancea nothofagi CBS 11611 TaxID=1266666 RepID=A0A1G4JSQ3_9SACH|nr:LANO_0E05094g1_1 [Lachancea nothofagi CBS 11611]